MQVMKNKNFSLALKIRVSAWAQPEANPLYKTGVKVGNGSHRVLRGGNWGSDAPNCRAAYRNYDEPANRANDVGFRLLSSLLRPKCIVYG
jgi:formylglycine-generating enzyme required for sulfatase activity